MRLLIISQYFPPEMGTNARALAERKFDRGKLAGQLESVLSETVEGS